MPITCTLYAFEELSDEAKENATEDISMDSFFWEDLNRDVGEMFERDLDERGLGELEKEYSLSSCQGDGVAFYGKVVASDITDPKFAPILLMLGTNRDLVPGHPELGLHRPYKDLEIVLGRTSVSNHYSHWNSFSVSVTAMWDNVEDEFEYEPEELEEDHPIAKAIEDYFRNLSREFEKNGYDVFQDPDRATYFFDEDYFTVDGKKIDLDDHDDLKFTNLTETEGSDAQEACCTQDEEAA